MALALPTQSTLLRGVVRIENRKAVYLLEDAEHSTGRLIDGPKIKEKATTLEPDKARAKSVRRERHTRLSWLAACPAASDTCFFLAVVAQGCCHHCIRG